LRITRLEVRFRYWLEITRTLLRRESLGKRDRVGSKDVYTRWDWEPWEVERRWKGVY